MVNTYATLLLCYIQLQDKIKKAYTEKHASKDLIDTLRLIHKGIERSSSNYKEDCIFFIDLETKVMEDIENLKKYCPDVFKNRY